VLLPPAYVQPYRRRSKTDRADCEAILEADRCAGIHPVSIKSEDQQALLALHRVRSQWLQTGTARINAMRGFLSEFGVIAQLGAKRFTNDLPALLSNRPELPARVRIAINELWAEVRDVKSRIDVVEHELEACAADEPFVQAQLRIPGIGVLTASALYATIGSIHTFKSGRQLACWLGLTPRESSSGGRRRLGAISKQGDPYLRMLLIHGARSALNGARALPTPTNRSPSSRHGPWSEHPLPTAIRPWSRSRTRWRASSGPCGGTSASLTETTPNGLLPDRHCERNRTLAPGGAHLGMLKCSA
jgi:transposase